MSRVDDMDILCIWGNWLNIKEMLSKFLRNYRWLW